MKINPYPYHLIKFPREVFNAPVPFISLMARWYVLSAIGRGQDSPFARTSQYCSLQRLFRRQYQCLIDSRPLRLSLWLTHGYVSSIIIENPGERIKTIRGCSINYIVLLNGTANENRFEVDKWSIGAILYTPVVGRHSKQKTWRLFIRSFHNKIKFNELMFGQTYPR